MKTTARVALFSALVLGFSASGAGAARLPKIPAAPAAGPIAAAMMAGLSGSRAGALKSAWTQLGPHGVLEARAVVDGADCPEIVLNLNRLKMKPRAARDGNFLTVCTAEIPAGTRQAALSFRHYQSEPPPAGAGTAAWQAWVENETGIKVPSAAAPAADWIYWQTQIEARVRYDVVPLALATPDPQRIVVLGDTGCRIKGKALQDCSNPVTWPFPALAAKAARLKPDLVIHVGDYLYRENACPADFKGCEGTPFGDNWPTWDADFFAPASPLLAAAPWVMVRGNHEDCSRAGPGFLRLLGPLRFDAAAPCPEHLAPFAIPFQDLNLVVGDDVDVPETSLVDKALPVYRQEFAALAQTPAPSWLLMHRPIWGLVTGPLGLPVGGNLTLMAAVGGQGLPAPVTLMLSGHIHTFEAINYEPANHVPPQIVAGFGGDMLDPTPANLRGAIFQGSFGVHVKDGLSIGGFGFLLMSKTGETKTAETWTVDVYDGQGRIQRQCLFQNGRVDCPSPAKRRR